MNEYLNWAFLWKFIKFGMVGFTGLFVDFGFTFVCKEWLKIPKYISNAIGFILAATSNYYLNRVWTFHSENPQIMLEFGQFFSISIVGLLLNTLVLYVLVAKYKWKFYLSKLFAIAAATLWNFFANYWITFA